MCGTSLPENALWLLRKAWLFRCRVGKGMSDQDQSELRLMAARLRQEHEDYDVAIKAMIQIGCEALRIQRMKKKKLIIKDRISQIEDQIIPDIIA
ncbi:hypothetical protein GCM10007908_17060 [Rhizobium albus]|jgi:hypothetical protein|nr:hypothetical protein GCM10007908_17060 [Rhizobium albus]